MTYCLDMALAPQDAPRRRGGRKPDPSRDTAIMAGALDVLAEVGFEAMTIDMVAARVKAGKGTVYRRWPSKTELVLDAVAHMERDEVRIEALPDTGSLREDIVALIRPQSSEQDARRLQVMGGLLSISSLDPRLAETAFEAGTGNWIEANRLLIARALERGEFAGGDVETLARVIPFMCTCRVSLLQQPITREFLLELIDGVLIPAMRGSTPSPPR